MLDYRVISIGTLAAHPLWEERADMRTGHATTSLIESGDARIIVDPGLPAQALAARMSERTNTAPSAITHVFLTSFQPDHRRALDLFPSATWMMHEPEIEVARDTLEVRVAEAEANGDQEVIDLFHGEQELLSKVSIAPDNLAPAVDLFPLPGVTRGTCGLLLPLPTVSLLVAGDAVATVEHLRDGKVLSTSVDVELAQESFSEAIEIAELLILGRGSLEVNPLRPGMVGAGVTVR